MKENGNGGIIFKPITADQLNEPPQYIPGLTDMEL